MMTRCAFRRGQTVLSCFVLCIAIASGKKGPSGRSFDTVQAAVTPLQRSAHRDPTTNKQSGRSLPIFQPKLSVQSKAQPFSLSGLDDIHAFLRPGHKEHHGVRRVQEACASQNATLYSCLPNDACKGCYSGQFTSVDSDISEVATACGVVESKYCAVGTTCTCGSGCEAEAESYYQCILEDFGCENVANCTITQCEQELINLADCDKGIGNVCRQCVVEAVQALFDINDTPSCEVIQSTVCASSDSCGCGQCADELELYFACFGCPDLSCTPEQNPTPATPTTSPGPPTTVTCDAEETAFYGCLDDNCDFCYERAIDTAFNRTTLCGELERELCAIPNTLCSSCGCDVEGLMYYQCIVENRVDCDITVNCTDIRCDQEFNAMASCLASQDNDNACNSCVKEAHDALFVNEDTVSCQDLEDAVCPAIYATCGCDYCSEKVESYYACAYSDDCPSFECTTPEPTPTPATLTTPPGPPTSPPTYSDPCYVCGDSDFTVDPTKTVKIGNEVRQCVEVQVEYESSQQVSPFECDSLVKMVMASCNCQSPSPPSSSPMASLDTPSGQVDEGSKNAALSALVAIPLIAVIVYLIKRNKADGGLVKTKASTSPAAPEDEFMETPPPTPSPNRHPDRTPDSHYHQTYRSATASSHSDEDYIHHVHHPLAVAPAAFQNSGGGWSASDHHHDSVGEVSGGSGRSKDPSGISADVDSKTPYASPVASLRNTGGYLPQQKDQCRSIAGEEVLPVAVIADEVFTPQSEHGESKRRADP